MRLPVLAVTDHRSRGVNVVDAGGLSLEMNLTTFRDSSGDEVLHHFLLAVDSNAPPREIGHGNAMALPLEPQLYAVVYQPLTVQALRKPKLTQQVHGAVLQHTGPDALLHV